jgi:amino acid transporter
LLLNTFFWNINYWETASCFAADIENPGKTYPLGMILSVILVFFALFFPVLIATGSSTSNYTEWSDGYFISLGSEIGGKYLSYWLICGAAATNIG